MIGLPEILIVGGIVTLLFGAKKIPELGRSIGSGIKELKTGLEKSDIDSEIEISEVSPEVTKE